MEFVGNTADGSRWAYKGWIVELSAVVSTYGMSAMTFAALANGQDPMLQELKQVNIGWDEFKSEADVLAYSKTRVCHLIDEQQLGPLLD